MNLKSGGNVQSVERSFAILETLAKYKNGCGITLISCETGLHKSTVHRLIRTMMEGGYVEKVLENDNYRLGMRILFLGSAILERIELRSVSRPYIQNLANITKIAVHLSILDEDEGLYVDKMESPDQNIRMHSQIGKRFPLHCTAVGKILLSEMDDMTIREIMQRKGMPRRTKGTITNIDELLNEISKAREQGYAIDEIENEDGIRCIAAPIYDKEGKIVAAISISGPIIYVTHYRLPELKEQIMETANLISYQLGYQLVK